MTEHSPLPWRRLPQVPTGIFAADENGSKVAATKDGHNFPPDSEKVAAANAAFIVKAVNSHDALVGALRFILAFYEPGQRHLDTEAWKCAEAGARAALRDAERHSDRVGGALRQGERS